MIKNYRSLVARTLAPSVLAASGVVACGTAQAQIASIQPVPLNPSSIGSQYTLIATGGATSGTGGPGATATNWDNSGNYFYAAPSVGLGTSTGTYGGYWGSFTSTSTNFGNVTSGGVTINTYFSSASGGSLCAQYCGGTYDNFPVFYYQTVGAQIGSGGGTATWNLNTYSGPSPGSGFTGANNYSDLYFATSGGSGATTLAWTLHFSNGATATGSFGVSDWASGSGGAVNSTAYSYGNGGYWQGSGNQTRYIYQYRIVNPDPGLTLTSISWTRSGGTNLNVLGISATGFVPAPPGIVLTASGALITSFSMLWNRRRKVKSARKQQP